MCGNENIPKNPGGGYGSVALTKILGAWGILLYYIGVCTAIDALCPGHGTNNCEILPRQSKSISRFFSVAVAFMSIALMGACFGCALQFWPAVAAGMIVRVFLILQGGVLQVFGGTVRIQRSPFLRVSPYRRSKRSPRKV